MQKVKYFNGFKYTWNEKENVYFREDEYGDKYYRNEKGEFHRENGPAYESKNGYKEYLINGKYHNENGPAVIYSDGDKSYRLNGNPLTEKEFLQWKRNQNLKYNLERILK